MKKLLIIGSLVAFMIFILPLNTFALPDPDCDPLDPLCPIDGGVTLLIAAGIGLGAKRMMKKSDGE